MTNKVKPFYIRITDDITPQMVQDAFDKCVDAGAVADECIVNTNRKHSYQDAYDTHFNYFGVDDDNITVLYDNNDNYGIDAQEITLDQLDEWLGLKSKVDWCGNGLPPVGVECEWKGKRGGYWVPCVVVANNDKTVVVQNNGDYKHSEFEIIDLNYQELRKPETPEQKAERERIENGKAIYDLMSSIEMNHDIAGTPNTWAELRDEWQSVYIQLAESVGYRKQ
jgi:hypothetical protein